MKRGRMKDPSKSKNRVVSVVLTEKAYLIYRKVRVDKGKKFIHKFVSEGLIDKYEGDYEEKILSEQLVSLENERDRFLNESDKKRNIVIKRLRELKGDDTNGKYKVPTDIGSMDKEKSCITV